MHPAETIAGSILAVAFVVGAGIWYLGIALALAAGLVIAVAARPATSTPPTEPASEPTHP
jgi:hypothetical protein